QELPGDVAGKRRLVRVSNAARADAGNRRHKRKADEEQRDRPHRETDAPAIRAGPALSTPRWPAVREGTPAGGGAVESRRGKQRARGEVGELDLPPDRVQRTVGVR